MALKFSEMTARRVDLARNLEAGFDHYADEIVAGYDRYIVPLLEEGETPPDVRLQLEMLKRGVTRSRQRLVSFDSPLLGQGHEDAKVRAELDLRLGAVAGKLRRLRHICRGLFGDEGVARVGLKDEPPPGANRLHEHGKAAKESLENPDLGLKALIQLDLGEGVPTLPSQFAAQLEPELSELGALVGERHEENRKGADVRSRRRRVLEEFDRDVRAIVRTAQGMFRLAGREDLAERFRPILQRVTRKKTENKEADPNETSEEPQEQAAPETQPTD